MSDFIKALQEIIWHELMILIIPNTKAAELAKKFDFDYWDGDRRICYGGYKYIPKRWSRVASKMIDYYQLPKNPKFWI